MFRNKKISGVVVSEPILALTDGNYHTNLRWWKHGDEVRPEVIGVDMGKGLKIRYNNAKDKRFALWRPGQIVYWGVGQQTYIAPAYYLLSGTCPDIDTFERRVYISDDIEWHYDIEYGRANKGISKARKIVLEFVEKGIHPDFGEL